MSKTDQMAIEAIKRMRADQARASMGLKTRNTQRRPGKAKGYGGCSRESYEALSRGW